MNSLADILEKNTDEGLVNIYNYYKEEGKIKEAYILRTAFIQKQMLDSDVRTIDENLKYLIEEENKSIDLFLLDSVYQTRRYTRLFESGLNAFINAKLQKETANDFDEIVLDNALANEIMYHDEGRTTKQVSSVLLELYVGLRYKSALVELLSEFERSKPAEMTRNLSDLFREGVLDIQEEQRIVEEWYDSIYAQEYKSTKEFDCLREQLTSLFLYNYFIENKVTARYFLVRLINVTKEEDYLFNVYHFIKKEEFDNIFQTV